jgi:4-hydroxy-2-oxoglutarate aldolase
MKIEGIFPALTTPFTRYEEVFWDKVEENVARLNALPLAGYAVCGSTGETPMLNTEERVRLLDSVKAASDPGRILIAGLASESVHEAARIAKRAAQLGYHLALALTPSYYRNQMQLPETQIRFYTELANRSALPVLLYNMPGVTGYDLPVAVISSLSRHPNIVGIKDSSGNLEKMKETVAAVEPGFQVLSGSGVNFGEALQLGASGAILAIANATPAAALAVWDAFRSEERDACREWVSRIAPLAKLIGARYGIPGLKHAMDLAGYYGGPARLPFSALDDAARQEIRQALDAMEARSYAGAPASS